MGGDVPYMGYVEVQLWIPEITAFDEDALMLVIEDNSYGQNVPIQIAALHVDRAWDLAPEDKLKKSNHQWKRGRLAIYWQPGLHR